ncbi:MAG: hypothetical protein OHK0040_09800 [bacterium]
MNIAEIRKKSKKKKDDTVETLQEVVAQTKRDVTETLPIPAKKEEENRDVATEQIEDIGFIDEENLYRKYSLKEAKELKEFLCFRLGDEEYGLDVSYVKEVIKNRPLTVVPKTMDFILGIISIRGEVIPLFDIKKLLDIQSGIDAISSKIVIIEFGGEKVSLLADAITQISKISLDEINPTPLNISGAKLEFIKGIAMLDGKMVRILDLEKILNF